MTDARADILKMLLAEAIRERRAQQAPLAVTARVLSRFFRSVLTGGWE